MKLRAIRWADSAQRAEWLSLVKLAGDEPFCNSGYMKLLAPLDADAVIVVGESTESSWILPLLVRPTPRLAGDSLADVASPYGYGGPYRIFGPPDPTEFLLALKDWIGDRDYVSAFLRLSLESSGEISNMERLPFLHSTALNIAVSLKGDEEIRWMSYAHKVRKNVNKARRAGCVVTAGTGAPEWEAFERIYALTMHRRGAADRYLFDHAFFRTFRRKMDGQFSIFLTHDPSGVPVSAELVLKSERRYYSFLGGTDDRAFYLAPNDLLKHEVCAHGASLGLEEFVLGGGYTDGDGIYRYKLGFSPREGVRKFMTARIVSDATNYAELSRSRHPSSPRSDYFPQYRAP